MTDRERKLWTYGFLAMWLIAVAMGLRAGGAWAAFKTVF
jgi:hypothetical protein